MNSCQLSIPLYLSIFTMTEITLSLPPGRPHLRRPKVPYGQERKRKKKRPLLQLISYFVFRFLILQYRCKTRKSAFKYTSARPKKKKRTRAFQKKKKTHRHTKKRRCISGKTPEGLTHTQKKIIIIRKTSKSLVILLEGEKHHSCF